MRTEFAGDVQAYKSSIGAQPLLIMAALEVTECIIGIEDNKPAAIEVMRAKSSACLFCARCYDACPREHAGTRALG